jgi:hypothetical protein
MLGLTNRNDTASSRNDNIMPRRSQTWTPPRTRNGGRTGATCEGTMIATAAGAEIARTAVMAANDEIGNRGQQRRHRSTGGAHDPRQYEGGGNDKGSHNHRTMASICDVEPSSHPDPWRPTAIPAATRKMVVSGSRATRWIR